MFVKDEDNHLQTEDAARASALSTKMNDNNHESSLSITMTGGVQYKFANGYTLSMGCGPNHYSSNQHKGDGALICHDRCTKVEVAVMNRAGGFVALPMDVAGWVKAANIPGVNEPNKRKNQ